MSEEKRFIKNKKILALSISLVAMCVLSGVLGVSIILVIGDNDKLSGDYDKLYVDYLELSIDFNSLDDQYSILTGEHIELEDDYNILQSNLIDITTEKDALETEKNKLLQDIINLENNITTLENRIIELETTIAGLNDEILILENRIIELETDYNTLQASYDALETQFDALQIANDYITTTIRQSILPVQYSIFAEAVRRYYLPLYLVDGMTDKEWYMGFAEFCRDIILHDTEQFNAFSEVSDAFSNALVFGSDTMYLAYFIMTYVFWSQVNPVHWLPNWDRCDLTGDNLTDINTIVDWCIDEIDYEYDLDITLWQKNQTWDYPKFPVETAFRTFGDCEDQAILCAAYLESCGLETAIVIFHDPDHPMFDNGFYHGVLKVHIEDRNAFWDLYPTTTLWSSDGGITTWCYLDSTWNVPFGSEPSWLQYYIDIGSISYNIQSTALCDIDGAVGENIGIECSIPT